MSQPTGTGHVAAGLAAGYVPGAPVYDLGGGEYVDAGEVGPVAPGVACQQAVAGEGGVRADVEVRKGAGSPATASAVGEERLAGQESGGVGEWLSDELSGRQCVFEVLDEVETHRHLCIHDRV